MLCTQFNTNLALIPWTEVCSGAHMSIAPDLKSCSYSEHELCNRYFTMSFENVFRICKYECVMNFSFLKQKLFDDLLIEK